MYYTDGFMKKLWNIATFKLGANIVEISGVGTPDYKMSRSDQGSHYLRIPLK